jgi:hypothetical protein
LPKGIKLSDGIVKFNGQQDPRIWLDDFMTAVKISGGSRDNALQTTHVVQGAAPMHAEN